MVLQNYSPKIIHAEFIEKKKTRKRILVILVRSEEQRKNNRSINLRNQFIQPTALS